MRRIEARCPDVAPSPGELAVVLRAKRVAVVLDKPEIVLRAERLDHLYVEWIAQCMRKHHGLRLRRHGRFQLRSVDVRRAKLHIYKHRHRTILHNWRNRCREARRDRDHFVATLHLAIAKERRSKRHERKEISRGTRIHKQRPTDAKVLGKPFLELTRPPPVCKPELERGVYKILHFLFVENSAGVVNA